MKKSRRIAALVLALMLVLATVAGCAPKAADTTTTPTPEPTKAPVELTIWTHFQEVEGAALETMAKAWAAETGNTVKVVIDKGDFQSYTAAAQSSKGPDVMVGMPHNDLGVFQKAGLLEAVPAGIINDADYANAESLNAVTWGGTRYGVPVAMETYALFYNTDKIKTPPTTVEDLVVQAKANGGFQYDINNFYFTYGWIAGNGGYVFKNNGGTLDPADVGLGNEGAIKAYTWIQSLTQKEKLMKGDIKGDDAKGAFTSGKTAFYLSGPWDVNACTEAKVPFAIAALPQVNGGPAKSFMGVQAAFVSAKSEKKDAAWDFMKYLIAHSYDVAYKVGHRIPVLAADLAKDEFKADTITAAFAEQAKVAEPMPNIPEMNSVWTPMGNNLQLLTQGKQTPAKTAELVVAQIKEGIAQQQ